RWGSRLWRSPVFRGCRDGSVEASRASREAWSSTRAGMLTRQGTRHYRRRGAFAKLRGPHLGPLPRNALTLALSRKRERESRANALSPGEGERVGGRGQGVRGSSTRELHLDLRRHGAHVGAP